MPSTTANIALAPKKREAGDEATAVSKKPKPSFPGKISKTLTIAQLEQEANVRGLDLGNVKHGKSFLLNLLGDGSASVIAMNNKAVKAAEKSKKAVVTTKTTKSKPAASTTKENTKASAAENGVKKAASTKSTAAANAKPKATNKTAKAPSKAAAKPKAASKPKAPKTTATLPSANNSTPTTTAQPVATATSNKAAAGSTKAATKSVKKPATAKADVQPRISDKLSLAQLKEEATARQLNPMTLPKLKADLLHYLVEGSIHVVESKEYKAYQGLLLKLASERECLYEASLQKKQAKEDQKRKLQEKKRMEKEKKLRQAREEEKEHQKPLHKHSFPRVHSHPLAETAFLSVHGEPRRGNCNLCDCCSHYGEVSKYTCEECDFDICRRCFTWQNKSDEEKEQVRVERRKKDEEFNRRMEEARRIDQERLRKIEEEQRIRWNPTNRFDPRTIDPPPEHIDINAPMKYTVWCSDEDRWYGNAPKDFDSSWATKEGANKRAEYLFFWKNPWGCEPIDVYDENVGHPKPETSDGLDKWSASQIESSKWTVGVVPASAYRYMDGASMERCYRLIDHKEDPNAVFIF